MLAHVFVILFLFFYLMNNKGRMGPLISIKKKKNIYIYTHKYNTNISYSQKDFFKNLILSLK